MTTITRFAPSPTGMLHIGGARTALFNYLFARRNQGKFLLRIEDTDKARSTQEAVDAILDGMSWLGLEADEAPLFQSTRADRHAECAKALIESGAAFRCYVTPEELQARREEGEAVRAAAKDENRSEQERAELRQKAEELLAPFRSPYRDGGGPPHEDAPYTVRLKAPDEGHIIVHDKVQGEIRIKATEIDDLILLRTDGSPTYMLAVVVDDHDMGVTHVVRGDDHLRNTFRQVPIFEAMGWDIPVFAHVPMIHGDDGAKLSKRHGALSTTAYREMGYLPEAMNAYLLRLGWSHGNQEIFTLDEAAKVFSLEAINKAPARLDLAKLNDVNAYFIRECDNDRLFDLLKPWLNEAAAADLSEDTLERIRTALPAMKDRGATLDELASAFRFFWTSNADNLNKKARKALSGDNLDRLADLRVAIANVAEWGDTALQHALESFCSARDLSFGQVGPPIRAALTGGLPAPDLAPVMAWLGRDETLARIDFHLARAKAGSDQEGHVEEG
ncbi:glutamate--tRNA ligase [Henriciella aquimarina]|uniref:glutamate--tRNA ligase n=1 Tax=Henriciella aquimarina TaxID=545261 RepID=UPI0009FFCD6E|nr:glutamate--tRNA ligase [Henriciella aquimarina]